jgi:hypothetical protein
MPVNCKIGTHVTQVDSTTDCTNAGGTQVPGQPTTEKELEVKCFVRDVLTRCLGNALLDIGWADSIAAGLERRLVFRNGMRSTLAQRSSGFVKLTPAVRSRLALVISRSIFALAKTYPAGLEFREKLLRGTPRGRVWDDRYNKYLRYAYRAADSDLHLLRLWAAGWLATYPFVKGMVVAATSGKNPNRRNAALTRLKYTAATFRKGVAVIDRLRAASKNEAFRELLDELQGEWKDYVGLTAEQAVAKLKNAPAK